MWNHFFRITAVTFNSVLINLLKIQNSCSSSCVTCHVLHDGENKFNPKKIFFWLISDNLHDEVDLANIIPFIKSVHSSITLCFRSIGNY